MDGPLSGEFDAAWCRGQYPALSRTVNGQPAVFFDGPGGSQTPQRVIDAVVDYLGRCNANHGGLFAASRESDALLEAAHAAMADFLGTADPETIVFGSNMTTLTLALSRAMSRTWEAGDEVVVTHLDHDANVTPWVLAARDAGAAVRHVPVRPDDCTLDLDAFAEALSPRTKLVAIAAASNAVGTLNPVEQLTAMAHERGASVFVDAVHYAPHGSMDVGRWGCDFVTCSAYKFFGPHVGVLWGRREFLSSLPVYKVRPAPEAPHRRWMTGTQNHEGIVGALAAVEYLAELGWRVRPEASSRREALEAAMGAIVAYERTLADRLLDGLAAFGDVRVWGIVKPDERARRVPTVSLTHARYTPRQLAQAMAERGISVWHGNFYALPLTEALGLEPEGLLRIGLMHYNTPDEVDRVVAALGEMP